MKIRIYPYFWPHYYAFYLEGIRRVFGNDSICYIEEGFPQKTQYDDGFAFMVEGDVPYRRIFLSANDHARIDAPALEWCDRYGIVNYDPNGNWQERYPQVTPIGPSFGVQSWGTTNTLYHGARWLARKECRSVKGCLQFIFRYNSQLRNRLPEHQYVPGKAEPTYIFYVSWPWKKHPEVNPPREHFIRACKTVRGLTFEGGFAPRRQKDLTGVEDITAVKRYPFREYMEKIRRSCVVFNCPAVHQCHGWKLGEFLALGKAIISIPLTRAMPAPLVHGTHIHFIEDSEEAMREAVELICRDNDYRSHLEMNARQYYLDHLAPEQVIRGLCGLQRQPLRFITKLGYSCDLT